MSSSDRKYNNSVTVTDSEYNNPCDNSMKLPLVMTYMSLLKVRRGPYGCGVPIGRYQVVVKSAGERWFGDPPLLTLSPRAAKSALEMDGVFVAPVQPILDKMGEKNWADPRHTDTAWVRISLVDVNDYPPSFNSSHNQVALREDAEVGTSVAVLTATDEDAGSNGEVSYSLDDPFDALRIDENGVVWVSRLLNREGQAGSEAEIRVMATDGGTPPLTATATLTVTLLDVNDCAPSLIPIPGVAYHIRENGPPARIGILRATDADESDLNHGPPFKFQLVFISPEPSHQNISLKAMTSNGNDSAEIRSLTSLDREEQSEIDLDVNIRDVGGLSATHRVKIIVDDTNDNKMLPGTKIIYVLKPRALVSDYRLGRVFVNDLDDWDLNDKSFKWAAEPHPQFVLDKDSGAIHASTNLPDGRYNLRFKVSDHFWQQFDVEADVSVFIKSITPEMFLHAVSISLSSISPKHLVKNWTPEGGGGILGSFVGAIKHSLTDLVDEIAVISVEENPLTVFSTDLTSTRSSCHKAMTDDRQVIIPSSFKTSSKVWIVASQRDNYLDPVKLKGLLELKRNSIFERSALIFSLEERTENPSRKRCRYSFSEFLLAVSLQYNSSLSLPSNLRMQVVDLNSTSLVTAVLSPPAFPWSLEPPGHPFSNLSMTFSLQSRIVTSLLTTNSDRGTTLCTKGYCLNGGQCVPTATASRCICPGDTVGPRCKVLSRSFWEGGWIWLPRLPSCLPYRISLRLLALDPDGIILYQGPLSSHRTYTPRPSQFILVFKLEKGRPVLTLEHGGMVVTVTLSGAGSLVDGKWHTFHLRFTEEEVSLMVDFCAMVPAKANVWNTSSCFSSFKIPAKWKWKRVNWGSEAPFQVGGVAHSLSDSDSAESRGRAGRLRKSFKGCISRLKIEGQLIDLGEPSFSSNSRKHCIINNERLCDQAFPQSWDFRHRNDCKRPLNCPAGKGRDSDGESQFLCDCTEGAASPPACESRKRSVTLGVKSYSSFALSFVPDPQRISIRLKFKTRSENGLLVLLSSRKAPLSLSLHISKGYLCLSFSTSSSALLRRPIKNKLDEVSFSPSIEMSNSSSSKSVIGAIGADISSAFQQRNIPNVASSSENSNSICVTEKAVSDGVWHSAFASRLGHSLVLQVDSGEAWQFNETLPLFELKTKPSSPPVNFWVDIREGVLVGGVPEYIKRNVSLVFQDLTHTCLDDLRISGRELPLPPVINNTRFGQVTTMQGMNKGCFLIPDTSCIRTDCPSHLQCRDVQGQAVCGCPTGEVFTPSGCKKMDLCLFNPCLNGGSCRRTNEGFSCTCPAGLIGKHCEWAPLLERKEGLTLLLAIGISVSLIVFFITVIVCLINIKRRRKMLKIKGSHKRNSPSIAGFKKVKDVTNPGSVMHVKTIQELGTFYPQDDLRNYAYEGEGSSAESLGSVFKGIQNEIGDSFDTTSMSPNVCEVVDLLKGLPDAVPSLPRSKSSKKCTEITNILNLSDVLTHNVGSKNSSSPNCSSAEDKNNLNDVHRTGPPRTSSKPSSNVESGKTISV